MSAYIKESTLSARACVIWLHGLGADARDMEGLAEQLPIGDLPLRHVCVDAPVRPVTLNGGMPMPAWYDIVGTALTDREDEEGIASSAQLISQVIHEQIEAGFRSEQIFLAGFSQGGAMALYTGLQMAEPLGGLIALSGYLPLASSIQVKQRTETPIFLAAGRFDPMVLPIWTQASKDWLSMREFSIAWHQYDMEHSVCMEEIQDLALWLRQQVLEAS